MLRQMVLYLTFLKLIVHHWYLLHLVHFNAYFILICSSFSYSHLIRRLNAMLMTIARIISFAHMWLSV